MEAHTAVVTASTGTVVVRTERALGNPPLPFFAPFSSGPPSVRELASGSSAGTVTVNTGAGSSLLEQSVFATAPSVFATAPDNDPFGLSFGLLQSQGTAGAVVTATADAPFTLFGFSRAELYSFFNTGESIAGNVFFVTGTATLVTVNPVVAGVAFTAKVTQAAFLVGKVAFSENPLNELVQSGVTFIAGKAAGAAAGQAFQAAKRAGLADGLIDSAVELASPLIRRGVARSSRVLKRVRNEAFSTIPKLAGKTVSGAQEVSSLLDQSNAFVRNAVSTGTDVANGLGNDAVAFAAARVTAVQNFAESRVDRVVSFFSGCIAFCGDDKTGGGVTVALVDPLVVDIAGDGISVVNQADSNVFFDMQASGTLNHVSWIGPEDGFLVRDINGNGEIDDARELFSAETDAVSRTGFEALARHDANADGRIDRSDPVFASLLVWQDLDQDGHSQPGELRPLSDYSISALPTSKVPFVDASPLGDIVFGGDAVTTNGGNRSIIPSLWEIGLVTIEDLPFLQGVDLPGGVRQYFAKDSSRLLVLTEPVSLDLGLLKARTIHGSDGNDVLDGSSATPVFIKGNAGDDVLTGGDRPDFLDGGIGADQIDGGAGNDILWIDSADTLVQGGPGFDIAIVQRSGAITIDMFTAGLEVLYSSSGNDTITMSGGNYGVRVRADAGDDFVSLSGGDDFISAGPGTDTVDGGGGTDSVEFEGLLSEYTVEVDASGEVIVVTVTDTVETREDGLNDGITVLRNVEKLIFDDRTQVLDGRNSAPVIQKPTPLRVVRGSAPVKIESVELLSLAIEFNGEALSLFSVGPATNGNLSVLANGSIIFEADPGFTGRARFQFTVEDPNGSKATGSVRFQVKPPLPVDELFDTQWHHDDIRSIDVWDSGITGSGVRVQVNDDKIQTTHPDLPVDVANSYDFEEDRSDPSPGPESDAHHGTFVTGCITAARNGIGTVGVAYNAVSRFTAGFGLGPMGDADVINLSWSSRPDFGTSDTRTYSIDGTIWSPLALSARLFDYGRNSPFKMTQASITGRGGLGTVVLASAGNDRLDFDRADNHHVQNDRHTMAIAAHDKFGEIAYFSSPGGSVFISCPGKDITSTDRTGDFGYSTAADRLSIGTDYANGQGTSYSSPICTGIVALMMEASNRRLGWRDYQDILALTALTGTVETRLDKTFPVNGAVGQPVNGGGFKSNQDYGFGLADAFGAVRLAETWDGPIRTSANEVDATSSASPNAVIPDGTGELNSTITLSSSRALRLMHVVVSLQIVHPRIGDLVIYITSPAGTSGLIANRALYHSDVADPNDFGSQNDNINFRFSSMRQWGEIAAGEWTLTVRDAATGQVGTLNTWELRAIGDFAGSDNMYVYTDDFGIVPGAGFASLADTNGGNDTINTAPIKGSVIVDLTPGPTGRTSIKQQRVVIGASTVIENAISGDGDDTLVGNDAENVLRGGRGDDLLVGSAAADVMDGGPGVDTCDYRRSTSGVQINLGTSAAQTGGQAEGDVLISIENVVGSGADDTIRGSSGPNELRGGAGDDTLFGGDHNDVLYGDDGDDSLDGGNGDDELHPGFGAADVVTGGLGSDVVVMLGHSSDYTVSYSGDTATITDGTNTATTSGVEFVRFSDTTLLLAAASNQAPSASSALSFSTPENAPLQIQLSIVFASVSDPENDAISFAGINAASNGTVTLNSSSLGFTPDEFFNGDAAVVITVHDNHGNFLRMTIPIIVTPVNTIPRCRDSLLSFPAVNRNETRRTGRVRAYDIDAGDTLTYAIVAPPTTGTATLLPNGSFTFLATGLPAGHTTSFTYIAQDTGSLTCTATVAVQVTGYVRAEPYPGRDSSFIEITSEEEASESYSVDFIESEYDVDGTLSTFFATRVFMGGPKIAVLLTGEIVYTWSAVGIDGAGLGVAARMFDSRGNSLRERFVVNAFTENDQACPALTALAGGGFVIAYQSFLQDASSFGVYLQRFDRLGFKQGDEVRVNDETRSTQSNPDVVALPEGGFVVTWTSTGQDSDSFGVYAKVYDDNGQRGAELLVNTETEGSQQLPALAVLQSGRWMCCWEALDDDLALEGIFCRLYDDTAAVGTEFRVNIGRNGPTDTPRTSVAAVGVDPTPRYPDGVFLVTFNDLDESPGPADGFDITGVRIFPNGTLAGPEERINRARTSGAQTSNQLFTIPGNVNRVESGVVAIWDDEFAIGQFFNRELEYLGGSYVFGVPRHPNGTFLPTGYTMRPCGAGSGVTGGVVVGWQEIDQASRKMHQRMSILVPVDNLQLAGPLTLIGTPASDTLIGDVKSDTFYGGGGFDEFFGQQALSINDRLIYHGPRSAFTLLQLGPALWQVTSVRTGDVDILHGIEVVEFDNVAVRINTAPTAVEDVIDPAAGAINILANDADVEDGAINPSTIVIVVDPEFGRTSLTGGTLSVLFSPGDPIGFTHLEYEIADSEGLRARATVRVRFDCDAVSGTGLGETFTTGTLQDAALCSNSFTLTGNGGSDVFTFVNRLGGSDIILDFTAAGSDVDQIALTNFPSITSFDQILLAAEQIGADTVLNLAGTHHVTLINVDLDTLTADNFNGALGRAPLQVNSYRSLGVSDASPVQMSIDTITTAQAATQGDIVLGTLRVRPAAYSQSLVVWESFPNNHPGPLPTGASPSQDGSGSGIYGQFLDSDGNKRGAEFLVNDGETDGNQFSPVVAAQLVAGWFWVVWSNAYSATSSGYEFTELKGNAILFDGEATCTNRDVLNSACTPANRGVTGPAIDMLSRIDGQITGGMAVATAGDGIEPLGHGLTYAFFTSSEQFCCNLFVISFPVYGASVLSRNLVRINERNDGTQLSSGTSRNAIAALEHDPDLRTAAGAYVGQLVVIGWLRVANIPVNQGGARVLILTLRTMNSLRAATEHRVEVSDTGTAGCDRLVGCALYHTHTTAFQVIALEQGAITGPSPNGTAIDSFNQFVVVHGFRRRSPSFSFEDPGERIAISVYTSEPGSTFSSDDSHVFNIPTLHSRSYVTTVTFDTGRTLNELGLSACQVPGGVAIAWGHKFAFSASPVILVQLFTLDGVAMGPFNIVSGFAGGQGSATGPPLHPLLKTNADRSALIVIWNQAKNLDRSPNTDVLSRTILLSELTNANPVCVDDLKNATEDATVELFSAELLSNDIDVEGDALSLVGVRVVRSNLVLKTGGSTIPASTQLQHRQATVTQPGLRAVYFPSDDVLESQQPDGDIVQHNFGSVLPPESDIGSDFRRIDFERLPNSAKFPPDVVATLGTLQQQDSAPAPWSGLPTYMTANYFSLITGSFELDRFESQIQFIVHANSAAALWVDGILVMISRERRPQSAIVTAGVFGPGRFVVGTGLVENLAAGPHTIRLHYFSDTPARGTAAVQTTEFEVLWRRQSDAQDCPLTTCPQRSVFGRPSGTDEFDFVRYVNTSCCGAAFVLIPSEILSHAATVLTDVEAPYTFTPPANTFGSVVLEYTAADPRGGRCTAEVTINVAAVNDAPEASDDLLQLDTIFGQLSETCREESVRLTGIAPGRRRRRRQQLDFSPVLQGAIGCGDVFFGDTRDSTNIVGAPGPDEAYTFSIPGSSQITVEFQTCESTFDSQLRIFRGTDEIRSCDDCGDCGSLGFPPRRERLQITLAPGTYTIVVEGFGSSEGVYTLRMLGNCPSAADNAPPGPPALPTTASPTLAVTPPPPPPQASGAIACGDTVTGDTTGAVSNIGQSSGEHYYTVTVSVTAEYTFSTCQGSQYDTLLRLYSGSHLDTSGVQFPGYLRCSSCELSIIRRILTPGTYTILVEGFGLSEGVYTLRMLGNCTSAAGNAPPCPPAPPTTASPTTPPPPPPQASGAIACGDTVTGDTTGAVSNIGDSSGEHYYTVTVSVTAEYTFSTCQGSQYDTRLRLYSGSHLDTSGVQLANVDDACGLQSIIRRILTPGTYTVIIEGFSNREGVYTMTAMCTSPPTLPPTASPTLAGSGYCSSPPQDLGGLVSPHQSTTIGQANTYNPSCGGLGSEAIYFIDLLPGQTLLIRQVDFTFDSVSEIRHGSSCPGANLASCWIDRDAAAVAFTNEASTSERVFYIVDSRGQPGAFEIQWSVTEVDSEPTVAPTASRRSVIQECTGIFTELTVPLATLTQNDYDVDGRTLTLVSIIGEGDLQFGQLRSDAEIDTNAAFSYIPTTGYRQGQPYYLAEDRLRYVIADEEPDADRSEAEIIIKVTEVPCNGQCNDETDVYDVETCEWMRAQDGGCDAYMFSCRYTCCVPCDAVPTVTPPPVMAMPRMEFDITTEDVISAEFEDVAPTATTDRKCKAIATCLITEYEFAAPSYSTNRGCRARQVCDFLLNAELEFPPAGLFTFEMFPGTVSRDRICGHSERSCDWQTEYLHHDSSNFDLFASGGYENTWDDWRAIFMAVDLQDSHGMVSHDVARTYGMWESLFVEVDINGDRQLHQSELSVFLAQNLTGPDAMSTRSLPGVAEGSAEQPTLAQDWSCLPLTICDPDMQYQLIPKALHVDRTCGNFTFCRDPPVEFESKNPTVTSDRKCTTTTQCDPDDQYETHASTPTTDRICGDILDCGDCDAETDLFSVETCQYFLAHELCTSYADSCRRTCCSTSPCPTTPSPTTLAPTTADPTTAVPTTAAPTTADPTTAVPTTAAPTTTAPTHAASSMAAMCDPCADEVDMFAEDTCQYFVSEGMCDQHVANCAQTCCIAQPDPCATTRVSTVSPMTSEPTTTDPTTGVPTTAAPTTTAPTPAAMCDPCADEVDMFAEDTCQYFVDEGMCDQHVANCAQTCCIAQPEPCTTTRVSTTAVPPPLTNAACPRNCGQVERGGGTCRATGRCLSCNENKLRVNGRCVNSLSCKGRRIQTGSMTDEGCRCLQSTCHFCARVVSGDTCRVCRDGAYLLDGACLDACPAHLASSGVGQFKRRCAEPFTCRSGRLVGAAVSYGCKCATEDNAAIAACQTCHHRAGEHGQHCVRCNAGQYLHDNRCIASCDGLAGMVEYTPGNYGRECRMPFVCTHRLDDLGAACKCDRSVGRNDCGVCSWDTVNSRCLRCTNSKYLRHGVCVDACRDGEQAVGLDVDDRECL